MFEYAAVLHGDFMATLEEGFRDIVNWFTSLPVYWYVIAFVAFVFIVRLLSGRKT